MAFCGSCGTKAADGVKFCPSCGKALAGGAEQPAQSQPQYQQTYQQPGADAQGEAQANPADVQENKTMAILAYIIFFIPLLTGDHKKSPFVLFHTNQGTVLFISAVVYSVVYFILSAILAFVPFLGWFLILLLSLCYLLVPVLAILGILNAVNGKLKELPLIGKLKIIK
ncbi:MAG: zinc-ribbon domain-containing protein [Acidobacteriota bacterium]|jgi:uncharacterized membrane protein|nr:zinc-ribbon domain-containing protein [Acidobacteriota bacterium]